LITGLPSFDIDLPHAAVSRHPDDEGIALETQANAPARGRLRQLDDDAMTMTAVNVFRLGKRIET
jgi:hypothetical protein